MIQFAKEPLTDALWAEAMPLLQAHWKEVAHYQDIPLNPDRDLYAASEEAGILRVFTARDPDGLGRALEERPGRRSWAQELVGYALYFVRPAPHYMGSVQAVQDVLYLAPDHRGRTALKFINYCDEQLQAEGVQAVYVHLKAGKANGHRAVLHLGYDEVDRIYAKRLDAKVDVEGIETQILSYRDAVRRGDTSTADSILAQLNAAEVELTLHGDGIHWRKRIDGPVMGDDWTDQAQHDYDTARFVGHPE